MTIPDRPEIEVYICKFRSDGGSNTETVVWSDRHDAQAFVEDQLWIDVEWNQEPETKWVAEYEGDFVAVIERVPIADPVSLSREFPDELAEWIYVDPDELVDSPDSE